ncbi:MAG: addiction module protein [Verrucomicrobiota bacterium]|nr:addiction module protein [Verrucomicrobiota bacterium]
MSATLERIEQEALALSPKERAEIVGKLWESLDYTPYPELSKEWQIEIERCRREIRDGKVKSVPGEEVSRKAQQLAAQYSPADSIYDQD